MNRTNKSKSSGPYDFDSVVSNTLSKAIDNIQTAANAMMDRRLSVNSLTTSGFAPTYTIGTANPTTAYVMSNGGLPTNISNDNSLLWGTSVALQDSGGLYPKVDIYDDTYTVETVGKVSDYPAYRVDIFVAGVEKDQITLHLEEGSFIGTTFYAPKMNIKVERKSPDQEPKKKYALKESKHSYSNRTVSLPVDADVRWVSKATLEHGVLSFLVRKLTEPKSPTTVVPVDIV